MPTKKPLLRTGDERRWLDLVLKLMEIPGTSGDEVGVIDFLQTALRKAGATADRMLIDDVPLRSRLGGRVGNLIVRLPGNGPGPRRMLMAHVDTVPICVGSRPIVRGGMVRPASRSTGLGADNRAGTAAILSAALSILERDLIHPPLTFFWPVQEEVGLLGARHVKLGLLGRPRMLFNFDGGAAQKITIGATGAYRMEIRIRGVASHAGSAPEKGVSAIAVAGLALSRLVQDGWHGLVEKGAGVGTSNVGVIQGGSATNVVSDLVDVQAEARSHDPKFRQRIVRAFSEAFTRAAREVRSTVGKRATVKISVRHDYEAFMLDRNEPCVRQAELAVRAERIEPLLAVANGGLDANWMTARGLPAVTLGCGQVRPHTVGEALRIRDYLRACRIALRLATGSEDGADHGT
jgi:tripeptide aminopeptidase